MWFQQAESPSAMTAMTSASWKKFFGNKASSLYYDSGIGADVSQVTSSNLTTSVISSSTSPNNYTNSNEIVQIANNLANHNSHMIASSGAIGGPSSSSSTSTSNNNHHQYHHHNHNQQQTPTARLKSLKNSAQISSAADLKSARDYFASNEVTKPESGNLSNLISLNSLSSTTNVAAAAASGGNGMSGALTSALMASGTTNAAAASATTTRKFQSGTLNVNILRKLNQNNSAALSPNAGHGAAQPVSAFSTNTNITNSNGKQKNCFHHSLSLSRSQKIIDTLIVVK